MTYVRDTRQRLQRATRFFARVESCTLECPHCGLIYQIHSRTRKLEHWDRRTGRFRCTGKGGCGRSYILGICAWPVLGAPGVATQTPEDQVPSPRQLAQMRKEGAGWWLDEQDGITLKRPDETNLTLEEERPDAEDDD